MEGPAAAVGPQLPPHVLVPGELPGRPRARLHRPLHAPRRRRPGPVQRPRHDAAPGLRGGTDRRRQRPQPVRPHPDRGQGGPADQGRRARPGWPPLRLAWAASAGRMELLWRTAIAADPGSHEMPGPGPRQPAIRRLETRPDTTRPFRPKSPSPSTLERWPKSSTCAPTSIPTTGPTGSSSRR